MDRDLMEEGIATFLTGMIGPTWATDPNFKDTPRRVAKMYAELLTPEANNYATFESRYHDLVLLRGHRVHGICPHHLMPVEMRVWVGYIPHREVLGLSKLARVVEEQLTRPVLQEDLTHAIAASLDDHLNPKGVAVIIAGRHGCMRHRGVETDADVVTSSMMGVFLLNPTARQELLALCGPLESMP